jgi:hypothetical protein
VASSSSSSYIAAYGSSGNKTLSQWHLNFFYNPIKNIDLGAELIQGKRTTFGGAVGDMSRLDLIARYSFN